MDKEKESRQVTYFILLIPTEEHVVTTLRGLPAWCEVVEDNGCSSRRMLETVGEEEFSAPNRGLGGAATIPEQPGLFGTADLLYHFVP